MERSSLLMRTAMPDTRFVVQEDAKLTAFLELELTIRAAERPEDCGGPLKHSSTFVGVEPYIKSAIRHPTVSTYLRHGLNKPQGLDLH